MRRRTFTYLVILVGLVIIGANSGCGVYKFHNPAELRGVATKYPDRTYAAGFEEVKAGVLDTMNKSGLKLFEEKQAFPGMWYAIGEVGASWASNGEFVRMVVEADKDTPSNQPKTKLYYHSIRRIDANVTEDLKLVKDKLLSVLDNYINAH